MLPTGEVVRGAKKGGITDHIAGPHLIPNVGREAMVPAECVRRQRPAPKPKPQAQPKAPPLAPTSGGRKKKKKGGHGEHHERRGHSHSPSPSHSPHRGSWSAGRRGHSASPSPGAERVVEAERQHAEKLAKLARQFQGPSPEPGPPPELDRHAAEEAGRREQRRLEEEQRKLRLLEEARRKKEELDATRRKKLGGLFALNDDDDEDDDAQKARAAMEKRLAEERRSQRERPTSLDGAGALGTAKPAASSSTVSIPPRITGKEGVTALDIDGSAHDHKFSKVWKDWDASKKDDPGEIARQFMKVSAIKRRGYCAQPRRGGSRSRSRSRRR